MTRILGTLLAVAMLASRQSPGIVGEWRGTSLCTDRKLAPACTDERVRYTVRALAAKDTVHLVADKLVGDAWEPMGEFDLGRDAPTSEWRAEFTSPRGYHGRWWFVVRGDSLVGGLTDLATGGRVRAVSASRR
jgi:hypothetical protein